MAAMVAVGLVGSDGVVASVIETVIFLVLALKVMVTSLALLSVKITLSLLSLENPVVEVKAL